MPEIQADHQIVLQEVEKIIQKKVLEPYPHKWVALKLLEGDLEVHQMMQQELSASEWLNVEEILLQHDDANMAVASGRYEWINHLLISAMSKRKIGQMGLTARLDRWATHPFWGLIILGVILGLVYWLTFAIGSPIQEWLDKSVIVPLGSMAFMWLSKAPIWLRGLVVDGIIGGVGSVITFLPILVIFFAAFATLEDIGYLARAAFMMDNFMHIMGLHGKSFMPLFLGFGCNVPAIMCTRVIDTWSSRLVTILIAPFVPCAAKMAVLAFLASAFFGKNALWVSLIMVLVAMLALVLSGLLLNRTIFKGKRSSFIMEMPLYHLPNIRTIFLEVWQNSKAFIRKAGSTILLMMLLVWLLSFLPSGDLEKSYLAQFGRWIEPLGKWMGLDWRLLIALITSFPAKENTIATLGVLFGAAEGAGLADLLATNFSRPSALAFMVVTMLFIPCLATVAVQKQETKSWGWTLFGIGIMLLMAFVGGVTTYQTALLLGF
jgi:ferrous iron transport protein B